MAGDVVVVVGATGVGVVFIDVGSLGWLFELGLPLSAESSWFESDPSWSSSAGVSGSLRSSASVSKKVIRASSAHRFLRIAKSWAKR